jgi:hypothetical protein
MALSSEKKKQIAAAVLGVVALGTVTWSLFFSDDSPSSSPTTTRQTTNKPGIFTSVNPAGKTETNPTNEVVLVSQPLDLNGLGDSTAPVMGRNIFIFPPPPPPPTPKPTPTPTPIPPPPITLAGMNPSQVTARTANFDMTVFGAKIPADARVLLNGAQYPTTVVNESQLKVSVPASVIANPGQVQVEVKGAADPVKMYSNRLTLNITAPPIPGFKYLGLIIKNGVSTAIIRDESESDLKNVRKGDKIGTRWQVTNITPNEIEILDITIQVKHRLPFTGENG